MKLKEMAHVRYTSTCCVWDIDTDELLAGPDFKGFSANSVAKCGNMDVKHKEYCFRENSDGKIEEYFDVYVKRGDC